MKFVRRATFILFTFFALFSSYLTPKVFAANSCQLSVAGSNAVITFPGSAINVTGTNVIFNDAPVTSATTGEYQISVDRGIPFIASVNVPGNRLQNGTLAAVDISSAIQSQSFGIPANDFTAHNVTVRLIKGSTPICSTNFSVQRRNTSLSTECSSGSITLEPLSPPLTSSGQAKVIVNSSGTSGFNNVGTYRMYLEKANQTSPGTFIGGLSVTNGRLVSSSEPGDVVGPFPPGTYNVVVTGNLGDNTRYCVISNSSLVVRDVNNPNTPGDSAAFLLCDQAATEADKGECRKCVGGDDNITDPNGQGYWTAFGCVKTSKEGIVTSFVRIGMGIAGGFVLLSILYGSFLLTTSSGDPTRVKEGQEMITSAIMGLLFVIFSIIILRFIGVSILQIPGFGT